MVARHRFQLIVILVAVSFLTQAAAARDRWTEQHAADWFNNTPVAFTSNGRINSDNTYNNVASGNPRLYDGTITGIDPSHPIASIDLSWTGSRFRGYVSRHPTTRISRRPAPSRMPARGVLPWCAGAVASSGLRAACSRVTLDRTNSLNSSPLTCATSARNPFAFP